MISKEKAEWRIKKFSEIEIIHYGCTVTGSMTWNSIDCRFFDRVDVELFTCLSCKKKIPNYVILQWKILTGE